MIRLRDDHGDDITSYVVHRDENKIINTIQSCGIHNMTIGDGGIISCTQGYYLLVEYFHLLSSILSIMGAGRFNK